MFRRGRESTIGTARAGETGEEAPAETGEQAAPAEIGVDETSSETGEEESSVAVALEEKAPKKPIVKLGDIIGVKF